MKKRRWGKNSHQINMRNFINGPPVNLPINPRVKSNTWFPENISRPTDQMLLANIFNERSQIEVGGIGTAFTWFTFRSGRQIPPPIPFHKQDVIYNDKKI